MSENPFDDWPGFTLLDLRVDEKNEPIPNEFNEWRRKWGLRILDAFKAESELLDISLKAAENAARLEAVKEFVLSRREDIENDIEDSGMLKPILSYFMGAKG